MKRLQITLVIMTLVTLVNAAEPYSPLFNDEYNYDPSSEYNIIKEYMKASQSETELEALKKWNQFLFSYAPSNLTDMADITELTLIRNAHYEFARLLYRSGQNKKADEIIKKATSITVYSLPNSKQGMRWCKKKQYCE